MLKTFSGRNASQNEYELRSFIELLKDRGVTSYLEVGARHGDTFHEVMVSLPAGSVGVAVDLPGGLWGKESSKNSLREVAEDLRERGYHITVILGDSQSREIADIVEDAAKYDAILIDGDHTYKGVSADFCNYGHLAQIVAFHDIVGFDQSEKVHGNPVEVPEFWVHVKTDRDHIEFVDDGSKMGIGVLL